MPRQMTAEKADRIRSLRAERERRRQQALALVERQRQEREEAVAS